MAGLSLGITWSRTPDIIFTYNDMEIARIKFRGGKNGKHINVEAKPYIKITRENHNEIRKEHHCSGSAFKAED